MKYTYLIIVYLSLIFIVSCGSNEDIYLRYSEHIGLDNPDPVILDTLYVLKDDVFKINFGKSKDSYIAYNKTNPDIYDDYKVWTRLDVVDEQGEIYFFENENDFLNKMAIAGYDLQLIDGTDYIFNKK